MKQTVYIYTTIQGTTDYQTLGRLTVENGIGQWVYSTQYKDIWVPDEVNYPLQTNEYVVKTNAGIPNFILDMMPDAWGKHLLNESTTALDYLLNSPNLDRFGHLLAGDRRRPPKNNATESFHTIDVIPQFIECIDQVQSHQQIDANTLKKFKTALGGARPKLTVRKGHDLYIAKPTDNTIDIATIESICLNFARKKGLNVCETTLEKITVNGRSRTVLYLKRFDRIHNQDNQIFKRIPTLSALSLLNATWLPRDVDRWSYPLLAQAMGKYNIPITDIHELYKRMVFNTLIGNDDDHPKNHAFYYINQQWRLAPLYDVVPNVEFVTTRLAMKIGIHGETVNRENLLSMCESFKLTPDEATLIINEVKSWRNDLKEIFQNQLSSFDNALLLQNLTDKF